jgi:hypothetical protein
MSTRLAVLLILASSASDLAGQTLGHWRFEEGLAGTPATGHGSVLDSVAGHHGTPEGEPVYDALVGPVALAGSGATNALSLRFFGVDESVRIPGKFRFHDPGDCTLEFWIHPAFTSHQSVFWTRPDDSDTNRFNIHVNDDDTLGLDYRDPLGDLHNIVGQPWGGMPLVPDTWTHVAIVRQGNTYSLYANGTLGVQGTDLFPNLPDAVDWQVSGRTGYCFDGLLDEVRVSEGALTPDQFLLAALADLGGGLAGLLGVPTAGGTGTLQAGTPLNLTLANAAPLAPTWLVVGLTRIDAPFKGGVMIPDVDAVLPFSVGSTGALALASTWPAGVPSGVDLYFQWWVSDAAGVKGFAASNGLQGTTP